MHRPSTPVRPLAALAFTAFVSASACAGELALEDRPCPCAPGFTCCAEIQVCKSVCPDYSGSTKDALEKSHATFADESRRARCLTQDADHLYFLADDGRLTSLTKADGTITESTFPIARQTMARAVTPACSLVLDETQSAIYFTLYGLGKIAKVSLDRTGPIKLGPEGQLFGELVTPTSLAIDETFAYVTEYDSGIVRRVPRDGSGPGETIARAGDGPREILIRDDVLFWLDNGGLRRMAKAGGSIVTLSTDSGAGLSWLDGRLYWTTLSGLKSAGANSEGERTLAWQAPLTPCPSYGENPSTVVGEGVSNNGVLAFTVRKHDVLFASNITIYRAEPMTTDQPPITGLFDYRVPCGMKRSAELVVADDTHVYWTDWDGLRSHPL